MEFPNRERILHDSDFAHVGVVGVVLVILVFSGRTIGSESFVCCREILRLPAFMIALY